MNASWGASVLPTSGEVQTDQTADDVQAMANAGGLSRSSCRAFQVIRWEWIVDSFDRLCRRGKGATEAAEKVLLTRI